MDGRDDDGPPEGEAAPAVGFGTVLAEHEESGDVLGVLVGDGPLLLGVWGIFEAAILPDAFQFAAAGGDEPDFAAFVGVDGVI